MTCQLGPLAVEHPVSFCCVEGECELSDINELNTHTHSNQVTQFELPHCKFP